MRAITVTDGFLIAIALYSMSALVALAGRTMAERASAILSVLGAVSGFAAAIVFLVATIVLAAACVVLRAWLDRPGAAVDTYLQLPLSGLFVLAIAIALLTMLQALVIRRPARSITWDCRYAQPTSRMQYTARSFGDWMTRLLPRFLAPSVEVARPREIFPTRAAVRTEAPDPFAARVYEPLVARFATRFERARRMQQDRLTLYFVYIFVTTLLTLGWAYVRPSLW
jgi:hypothetical protein